MKHWQDPLNLILGLWLIASPWVLGHEAEMTPTYNAVAVGILVAALAVLEFFKVKAWEEWTSVALGVWLAISPWLLGFSITVAATTNALIIGIAVAALALWALGTDKEIGGWWTPAT
jgi:hypothetical protein